MSLDFHFHLHLATTRMVKWILNSNNPILKCADVIAILRLNDYKNEIHTDLKFLNLFSVAKIAIFN